MLKIQGKRFQLSARKKVLKIKALWKLKGSIDFLMLGRLHRAGPSSLGVEIEMLGVR